MIRSILYVVALTMAFLSQAQLVLQPIDPPAQTNARTSSSATARKAAAHALTLPFWDDFSTSTSQPDTSKWETSQDVYVNTTLAQNPPTYKVATFDGLKQNGKAHDISNDFNGPGDSLMSQPIDLSQVSLFNQNTVYLSFYWQVKGNGEIPDKSDSLRLQFLMYDETTDSSQWVTKWVINGGTENLSENFAQTMVQVDDERFFHENFRFKFQSFSSLKGPFDTWHIDYVYLNENRSANNIFYQDRSLSGTPTLLFAPYHEIPASHFYNSQEVSRQQIMATNLDSDPHPISYHYEISNASTGTAYFKSGDITIDGFDGFSLGVPIYGPENISLNITEPPADSVVISASFIYDTEDSFLSGAANANDSITAQYTLHNYYAYDDGTAEFAAAINQLAGQVAMRFALREPDTITHIDIYFPNIAPESTGATVDLIVWDQLSESGERMRQSFTVEAPRGLNQFSSVKLSRPVLASDTVYIGYQQYTDNFIGVGFDRNNAAAKNQIFTNINETWEQNERLEGVLMIRPVFGTDTTSVVLDAKPTVQKAVDVYPNPTDGIIRITGSYEHLALYDMSGQLILESGFKEEHDLRFLEKGLYLIRIISGQTVTTKKLLRN